MRGRRWTFVLVLVLAFALPSSRTDACEDRVEYELSLEDLDAGVVRVRAVFPAVGGVLHLQDRGQDLLGDGQQIEELRDTARAEILSTEARAELDGRPLELVPTEGGWSVDGRGPVRFERRFHVPDRSIGTALAHPFACSLSEEAGVLLGLDLFPVADPPFPHAPRVRVLVPEGWSALSPWPVEDDAYRPEDVDSLLRDFVTVGADLSVHRRSVGRQRFTLCLPESLLEDLPDCPRTILDAAQVAATSFGPLVRRDLVMTLLPMSRTGHQRSLNHRGANAPASLVAYVDPRYPEAFREHPLAVVVHEMTHWWNGRGMNFRPGHQHPWFTEGSTSYLEALLLLRCGAIDGEFFLQSLVDRWFRARAGRPARFSLEEASARFTRDLGATAAVYERGALSSFALDLDLRAAGSSLEALVRRLVIRGTLSGRLGQSSLEILSAVQVLAGPEALAALRERTATKAGVDIDALLRRVGYELWMRDAPLLGVRLQPRERPVVEAVQPGTPAEGVLQAGDVLCAIADQAFDDPGSFERVLRAQAPGQEVEFRVLRQGQAVELKIRLGRRPEPRIRLQPDANRAARDLRTALFGNA